MSLAKVYWDKEIKIALLVFIAILFIIAIILLCYELFFNRNNNFLFKKRYRRNILINADRKYEKEKTKDFIKEHTVPGSYYVRRTVSYKTKLNYTTLVNPESLFTTESYNVKRVVTYKKVSNYTTSTIPSFINTPTVYDVKRVVTYKPSVSFTNNEPSVNSYIDNSEIVRKIFRKQ